MNKTITSNLYTSKNDYAIKIEDNDSKPNPYFKLNFAEDLSMRNSP